MSDREHIYGAIRSALSSIKERAPLPASNPLSWRSDAKLSDGGTWQDFERNFTAVNGTFLASVSGLNAWLIGQGARHGYCDPKAMAFLGESALEGITIAAAIDRNRIDDYHFGITLGRGAIAETGSIILQDQLTSDRLGALAPWIHVALIPRDQLFTTVTDAILALGSDPNSIFVTGPSKTADVEGILIEGVHGPGIQVCIPV